VPRVDLNAGPLVCARQKGGRCSFPRSWARSPSHGRMIILPRAIQACADAFQSIGLP